MQSTVLKDQREHVTPLSQSHFPPFLCPILIGKVVTSITDSNMILKKQGEYVYEGNVLHQRIDCKYHSKIYHLLCK